jgi:hypothetical protein
MKSSSKFYTGIFFCFLHFIAISQSYPDISGTWYAKGIASAPASITQNGNQLNFSYNQSNSSGYFSGNNQIFAKEWNAAATIEADGQTITWNNQVWKRNAIIVPNITGSWYANGDPNQAATVTQDGFNVSISFNSNNSSGYFYETNKLFIKEWNAYGEVSTDANSISWNNQSWTRATGMVDQKGVNRRYCRFELAYFYAAAQLLGSAWGRSGTEPTTPTPIGIAAIDAHLNSVVQTLTTFNFSFFSDCIKNDLRRVTALRGRLRSMTSPQIAEELNSIILELQTSIGNAPFVCDNGVHPLALYVGGIHLGAAQAWASAQQCMPTPMPARIATIIRNHLTTASNALTPYAPCLNALRMIDQTMVPAFNFGSFAAVPLASLNSIEAHTNIVGIHTQLFSAVSLSPCCCNCAPKEITTPNTGNECDKNCQEYCKQKGYQRGKYNGRVPCMLGVVHEGGCDCN